MGSEGKRVYRDSGATFFGVLVALSLAGFSSFAPLIHLISGTPMMLSTGRQVNSAHYGSTPGDLWYLVICWGLFGILGVYLVLSWLNARIETSSYGIVGRNLLRRIVFRASWDAIDRVERKSSNFSRVDGYVMYSRSQRVAFKGTYPDGEELVQLVRRNCPHLDTRAWR